MRKLNKHKSIHYLSLLLILASGVLLLMAFPRNEALQLSVLVGTAFGYVAWGVVHHHIHRDLNMFVVVEYISIAILGLVLIYPLIF